MGYLQYQIYQNSFTENVSTFCENIIILAKINGEDYNESMMYEEQTNFDEFDGSSEAENAELSFFESTNEE